MVRIMSRGTGCWKLWKWVAGWALAGSLLSSGWAASGGGTQATVAREDYRRAEGLVRDHRWDEGLAILGPLIAADPANLRALNLAALAYTGKGDIARADDYFSKALKVDPDFVPALKNLAINEFNRHQMNEAERHLLLAAKSTPADPVVNLYLGELFFERRNFARAAEALSRSGPFLSRDPDVAAQLAVSYLAIGEKEKAAALLDSAPADRLTHQSQFALGAGLAAAGLAERAIPYLMAVPQSGPGAYDAAFDLALCYLNLKQYPAAIDALKRLIDNGGETSEADNLLAEAYEGNHETQPAIDALRKAIALAPDDDDNYLDFAALCMDHQDFDAGLRVLDTGLRVHPNSDRLLFERGILHAMRDNFQLAELDFRKAALLAPEKSSSYKGLGVLYLETGNAAQAIETLRKRLRVTPNDPDLLYLLGEALLKSGARPGDEAYRQAQTALESSVKLNPRLCLPHVSLGRIYLEEDRATEAVAQLEQAREIDPNERSTYWQLAVAYRKLGQTGKQREALSTLKGLNNQERAGARDKTRLASESRPAGDPGGTN
jgi:tetratricopeptide (TPR) repeat protein